MTKRLVAVLLAVSLGTDAFSPHRPSPQALTPKINSAPSLRLNAAANDANDAAASDRRAFISESVAAAAVFAASSSLAPARALAEGADSPEPFADSLPVCVIGSNGRTGRECVGALVDRSIPVRATTRSGKYGGELGVGSDLLTEMPCDVTREETIEPAVKGCRAVIFAASASKEGGAPSAVDNVGLVRVARACLAEGVQHLIIVSSGAVTKPASPVYLFLNLFGNIMEEKIRGEDAVRMLYAEHNDRISAQGGKKLYYTVVRPGGLTTDPPRGAAALELNQGDTKSGRISRADVAALCVESIRYPQYTGGTTFECYDADTGAPLASVGLSNIMKSKTDNKDFVTGKERRGQNWGELFRGLERD